MKAAILFPIFVGRPYQFLATVIAFMSVRCGARIFFLYSGTFEAKLLDQVLKVVVQKQFFSNYIRENRIQNSSPLSGSATVVAQFLRVTSATIPAKSISPA